MCRVQTELGAQTAYLLCAPMVRRDAWGAPIPRLHVPVDLDGEAHLVLMSQMIALPTGSLGPIIGSVAGERDAIVRAVDLLVLGF